MTTDAPKWSLPARILWIAVPVAVVAALVAFILWPRAEVFYSDGKRSWPAQPGLGLRSVLWDAGDLLVGLGDADQDYDPCLSGDGQELYFTRGKAGGGADIYVAYRTLDGWTEPKPLDALNTPADEIGPALARDGATLYFYSNRPGGEGGYDLYVSRHTHEGWSPPKNLGPRVNTPFNEYDPSASPDGTQLLFASNRPAEGRDELDEKAWRATLREEPYQNDYDLYALDLQDEASAPRRLDAVSSAANDGQPTLSADGRWLYFASDRPGGEGGYDLWRSRVTLAPLGGLLPPEALGRPVNTAANELDPAVSLEGFGLYFSSNRAAPETYAIYYARSHEVFQVVQTRRLAIGHILGRLSWPLIGLVLALIGLALTLLALVRLRRRPGLLATAMMVSLILHLVALSLFTVWQITYRISELAKEAERFEVAITIPGIAESELSSQLRAALSDLARLDTAQLAADKSDQMTAPEPPELQEPEVALAEVQPVPQEIQIARLPDRPEDLAEPLRPQVEPAPVPEPLPPEPLAAIQPKAVRPAETVELLQPRPVALDRAESAPLAPEPPPVPTPVERRADVPPALAPVALSEVEPQEPTLAPVEITQTVPKAAKTDDVLDIAPVTAEVAVRPVRVAAQSVADTVSQKPLATARAEAPAPLPATIAEAPRPAAPSARPAVDTTLLAAATAPPIAADAAAIVLNEDLVAGPAIAPAAVPPMDTLPPASGPVIPKHPAPDSNGRAETEPGARAVVVTRRADEPVAAMPAPSAVGPNMADQLRLGPDAVAPEALASSVVAAVPSAAPPRIDVETAEPGRAALPPAAMGPVDLTVPVAPTAPPAILPAPPPVAAGPRDTLAAPRWRRPAGLEPADLKAGRAEPLAMIAADPVARTLLASAVPAGKSMTTPVLGDSIVAAALPPASPMDADVTAPPAPVPPKEVYRLRTEPDRREMIEKLGGTPETEEAVRRALVWFARHQSPDGRWDVDGFSKYYDENGRRADGGGTRADQDVGVTALAALSFIGAGHTHMPARGAKGPSEYAKNIQKAIDYLLAGQKDDGDLRRNGQMYDHCLATMVLCESFSMTGDERLVEPIKRAVDFIVKAQNPGYGWRYEPRSDNDTSVAGWALMALKSAEIAGFQVPRKAYRGGGNWLDKVRQGKHGGLYVYQPGREVTPSMTAEGLFAELLIDPNPGSPRTAESVEYILRHRPMWRPRNQEDTNLYYWYYATMVLHQLGGPKWDEWNAQIRDTLVKAQRQDGPYTGSWDPCTRWDRYAGRVYSTALAALTLEVYYRYMPFYDLRLEGRDKAK